MKGDMITDRHLGGYVEGGDPATYYPELWDWLVKDFGVRSVIDVGCGDGVAVRHFQSLFDGAQNGEVLGVDGCKHENTDIIVHDYITGAFTPCDGTRIPKSYDLCWSCEFVEHVKERYVPNFLATFACAKHVLMTHAAPGQAGHHHVNCRPRDYWEGALAAIGFSFDATLTQVAREKAALNTNPWNHFKRSGLALTRN